MEYSIAEVSTLDVDWFAVDKEGCIAHFASAGGPLPKSVANSKDDNEFVSAFFRSLPADRAICETAPEIARFVELKSNDQSIRYFADFRLMAARGAYSYDTSLSGRNRVLFRVCSPCLPLKLSDVPRRVAVIVQRTSFSGRFSESATIELEGIS